MIFEVQYLLIARSAIVGSGKVIINCASNDEEGSFNKLYAIITAVLLEVLFLGEQVASKSDHELRAIIQRWHIYFGREYEWTRPRD